MASVFITNLQVSFDDVADKNIADGAKAYMRNQFEFVGIRAAERRTIFKDYLASNYSSIKNIEKVVLEMWNHPQRDFQYCAIDLLLKDKKNWTIKTIDLFEYLITNKSWWDTVDHLASTLVGLYFKKFPENKLKITQRWNKSSDFWLNRTSIIFQLKYKKDTDFELMKKYILPHTSSKEFFVQKAIGWALREYSKYNSDAIIEFVSNTKMANLSKREALRLINK